MGMRPREPGMCCGCGDPFCNIGPFVLRCGESPYQGLSSYAERRGTQSYDTWRLNTQLNSMRSTPPIGYRIDEWEKIGEQSRQMTMMRVETWRSLRTGETYLRALPDEVGRQWERPNFPLNAPLGGPWDAAAQAASEAVASYSVAREVAMDVARNNEAIAAERAKFEARQDANASAYAIAYTRGERAGTQEEAPTKKDNTTALEVAVADYERLLMSDKV
jgi:hypothetical protein